MAINSNSRRDQYTANGVLTTFAYTFEIFNADDIDVYVDGTLQTRVTHYTVSGVGVATGGNVVFGTAPANNAVVTIQGNLTIERTVDYQQNGSFLADTVNADFDKLVAMVKEQQDELGRTVVRPTTSTSSASLNLPDPTADNVLGWNAAGTALENKGAISDITTLAGIAGDITTVSGISANVTTVAANDANVTLVAAVDGSISVLGPISANITTVAGISADVTTVAADATDIGTVSTNIADVNTVATNIASIAAKMNASGSNYDGTAFATFLSTGIDDNATSNAITLDANDNLIVTNQAYGSMFTLTSGTSITIDMDNGNVQEVTLGHNATFGAPSNLKDGATYVFVITQDGTGGRTLAFNSVFKFPAATAPVVTATAGATDVLAFVSDGTNLFQVGISQALA